MIVLPRQILQDYVEPETPAFRQWMGTVSTIADGLVPSGDGAPTHTPTPPAGYVESYVDVTNLRVYFYIAGTWRYAALT